jgi:leucyl aminopeptidase
VKVLFRSAEARASALVAVSFKTKTTSRAARHLALPPRLRELAAAAFEAGHFRGETGEVFPLVYRRRGSPAALFLVGLGERRSFDAEKLRQAFGSFARSLKSRRAPQVALLLGSPICRRLFSKLGWERGIAALVEGWCLGCYEFDRLKTRRGRPSRAPALELDPRRVPPRELADARRGAIRAQVLARAVNLARDLSNTPPNLLGPTDLAAAAKRVAKTSGLSCSVLKRAELERGQLGALLAVGQGSTQGPRLIVIRYRSGKRGAKQLALVGKAVTFDSGGISIKPAQGMEEMKFDMAGGAAVLGALQALAELKAPLDVVGVIPACENLISGSALRPGDVVRSASGKTIEVINTDAEGRLILADAIHYAHRFRPAAIVDVATLTGACVVALGSRFSGLMSNDRELAEEIRAAGDRAGERVWELPLGEDAGESVRSQVADIKNFAGKGAGAITAAAFLSHFVAETPWAHLDIAGTAWTKRDEGYHRVGATGVGVRILVEFAERFGG